MDTALSLFANPKVPYQMEPPKETGAVSLKSFVSTVSSKPEPERPTSLNHTVTSSSLNHPVTSLRIPEIRSYPTGSGAVNAQRSRLPDIAVKPSLGNVMESVAKSLVSLSEAPVPPGTTLRTVGEDDIAYVNVMYVSHRSVPLGFPAHGADFQLVVHISLILDVQFLLTLNYLYLGWVL